MARHWTWNHYARIDKDGRVKTETLENPVRWSDVRRSDDEGWALIVE